MTARNSAKSPRIELIALFHREFRCIQPEATVLIGDIHIPRAEAREPCRPLGKPGIGHDRHESRVPREMASMGREATVDELIRHREAELGQRVQRGVVAGSAGGAVVVGPRGGLAGITDAAEPLDQLPDHDGVALAGVGCHGGRHHGAQGRLKGFALIQGVLPAGDEEAAAELVIGVHPKAEGG